MKIAVVGATGLVGTKMLQILEERNFPVDELIPVASKRSIGKEVVYKNIPYKFVDMQEAINRSPAVALFSAGSATSLEWALKFSDAGITVIDNSSAWRMHEGVPLVVPEVNGNVISVNDKIIANPNCSTIQMVVALYPLHKKYKINRIVVSTYQSVTGTGKKAVEQLTAERLKEVSGISETNNASTGNYPMAYKYPIDLNVIPQVDVFIENGYTKEEMKMINETKKIMGDQSIRITATTVRIPVIGGHSESVNVEFETDFDLTELREVLEKSPGVTVIDDLENQLYPMPINAHDKDDVFVGRLRRDESQPNTLNMWIVSDNLRKGAATNAIQIAEHCLSRGYI